MKADEIKNLIDKDIDAAFESLDSVCIDSSIYLDLSKEYVSRPNNFDLATFRSKLKRFVANEKKTIEAFYLDRKNENSINSAQSSYETDYQELCKLNFKHQIGYFEKLIAVDKPLIQFVIRGEKGYGQRWLCNKLLYHYEKQKPIHKVCKLDFSSLGIVTMQDFLDNLATNLKVEGYEKQKTIKLQRAKLSNSIIAKIKAQSQIFVLENFYNFLHSDGCVEFYNFIEDLYIGIVTQDEPVKGQCVFLFIENIPNPYQQQDKCIFTSQYDNIRTAKSAFENDTQFKIVDLHEIKQISKECINGWLDDVPEYILQHFPNNETINTLLYNCDNGHPEKVIAKICEKLGKTSEYPNKWLKY